MIYSGLDDIVKAKAIATKVIQEVWNWLILFRMDALMQVDCWKLHKRF